MQTFHTLVFLTSLIAVAVGVSPPAAHVGHSITLERGATINLNGVANTRRFSVQLARVHSKLQRGFAAYAKNTGTNHPDFHLPGKYGKRALSTIGIPLTDEDKILWHGTVSVGNPGIQYKVDFDTGSSDLFLPSSDCKVNCAGHTRYNVAKSKSARKTVKGFELNYLDGSHVKGVVVNDTVSFSSTVRNGSKSVTKTVSAHGAAVGAASEYSAGFAIDQFAADGLLGLAFPHISHFGRNPVLQNLIQQKQIAPVFGVKLATSQSELMIGGINPSKYKGVFTWAPVTTIGFWEIRANSIQIKGRSFKKNFQAIVDTGTTVVMGDEATVRALYKSIPGSKDVSDIVSPGAFSVPCKSIPTVSIQIGKMSIAISPATFNLGQLYDGSKDCLGGIVIGDADYWILGDVFLQNVYTQFDIGKQRVGFAALR